jgi:hypothetical protein
MSEEKPVVPALPGGPDPSQPVPRTPVGGLDLAAYARASVRLAERDRPRAAVLAELGLDEARWIAIEQTWLLRIATAMLQQDASLPAEYEAAHAAAQGEIAGAREVTLEAYAGVVAAIEAGREPSIAIAEGGLTPASFAAAQRSWSAKIAADPAIESSFRALVEARRAGG